MKFWLWFAWHSRPWHGHLAGILPTSTGAWCLNCGSRFDRPVIADSDIITAEDALAELDEEGS